MNAPLEKDVQKAVLQMYRGGARVKDIAAKVGSSIATVSRTLGKHGARLSPEELAAKRIAAAQTPEVRAKRANSLRRPLQERFDAKVIKGEGPDDCWSWDGATDGHGYPQMREGGKVVLASHVSLALIGQPRASDDLCALHKCDNPPCCNPRHLWWGTRKENSQDALRKGRLDLSGFNLGRWGNAS